MVNKILGNEKAILGGGTAGILAVLGQVGVNGQMTVKEAVYALLAWVFTHAVVFITTNSPKLPISEETPKVEADKSNPNAPSQGTQLPVN